MGAELVLVAATTDRRRAGIVAAVAGGIGLISFALLVAAVVTHAVGFDDPARPDSGAFQDGPWTPFFRGQDVTVALQGLLMLPVTLAIRATTARASSARNRATTALGISGHAGVVLAVALVFAYHANWADMLYMFPQGLIGVWLIALCGTNTAFSLPFRTAGMLAGLGLVMVTASAAMIASALGWHVLDLTETPSVDATALSAPGNRIAHALLPIGTLLGRVVYPVWSIVLGWKLFHAAGSPTMARSHR